VKVRAPLVADCLASEARELIGLADASDRPIRVWDRRPGRPRLPTVAKSLDCRSSAQDVRWFGLSETIRHLGQRPRAAAGGAVERLLRSIRQSHEQRIKKICECRCGAPGWRTIRLGVGDPAVTRKKIWPPRRVLARDLSSVVTGTGLAHQLGLIRSLSAFGP